MKTLFPTVAMAAILLTGCWQKSVQSFFRAEDVKFDDKLIATWHETDKEDGKGATWTITKGGASDSYRIQIHDDDVNLDYDAHLFKLGEERMLDLHSRTRGIADIPAHHLFRVNELGATLKIQLLSADWIEKYLKEHPSEIAHMRLHDPESPNDPEKGETVLTASTEQLQRFVRDHTRDEGFWSDSGWFKKITKP